MTINIEDLNIGDSIILGPDTADVWKNIPFELVALSKTSSILLFKTDPQLGRLAFSLGEDFNHVPPDLYKNIYTNTAHIRQVAKVIPKQTAVIPNQTNPSPQIKSELSFFDNSHRDPPRPENSPWKWL